LNPLGIGFAYTIAATGSDNPISFDLTYFAMIFSFLILVWFLAKYAWKPLMDMMEKRRQFIEDNLAHAEQERNDAEKIRLEYQEEMRQARSEAQSIIESAIKISEQQAAEIIVQARKENERMKEVALADIGRERDKAITDVKAQVADMSVAIAEKIIRQKLDMTGQEALIDQFIQEVGDKPC